MPGILASADPPLTDGELTELFRQVTRWRSRSHLAFLRDLRRLLPREVALAAADFHAELAQLQADVREEISRHREYEGRRVLLLWEDRTRAWLDDAEEYLRRDHSVAVFSSDLEEMIRGARDLLKEAM
jgi:hypothetical protein